MKIKRRFLLLALSMFSITSLAQDLGKPKPDQPNPTATKQPVLVLLHARFEDHVMMGIGEDRLFRTIKLIETLHKDFPTLPLNVSCEFSGAFAQELTKNPTRKGYLERIQALARADMIDIGYIGEDEPTYRNRPKAKIAESMSPEQRWMVNYQAAQRFLNEYKEPLTGDPDSARTGGLRAVTELIGKPTILGAFAPKLGAEAPYYHELRRMNVQAVVPGLPDPYFTMGIHGYRLSAINLAAKGMVPVPLASSELFWDSGFLRASFTSSEDIRRFSGEEGKEALAKLLDKLDRSHVRVLHIEVADYARYLEKWPDGTPKLYPLTWAYDHPDEPNLPSGTRAFTDTASIDKAYANEEQALRYLFTEFFPTNPGSRVVSPRDLLKMAKTPVGSNVSAETLKAAAQDWLKRGSSTMNMAPTYVEADGTYFSAADLFQLLANALAETSRQGKPPRTVRLTDIYGPRWMYEPESSAPKAEFTAAEVAAKAAEFAPSLDDETWQPVPVNAVPARLEIKGHQVNAAQFLALMVEAYLAGSQETKIKLRYLLPITDPGYYFPRQSSGIQDGGNMWTLRPAVLQLEGGQ